LARQVQQGCQDSFTELVERYGNRLLQFLRNRTGTVQDAEDLMQDTFVKAYQNIHRYRDSCRFSTWLFTIAKRLSISRHRSRRYLRPAGKLESEVAESVDAHAQEQIGRGLWATARSLAENQYQALWLKYAEDMSIKEIAAVTGKTQVNVKVLLYRARTNLAKKLRNVAANDQAAKRASPKQTSSLTKFEGARCSAGSLD
jgi:RNA polymerase sigma-70 factor (ECF subfamily)